MNPEIALQKNNFGTLYKIPYVVGSLIPPNNAETAAGNATFRHSTFLHLIATHKAVNPGTVVPAKNQRLMKSSYPN